MRLEVHYYSLFTFKKKFKPLEIEVHFHPKTFEIVHMFIRVDSENILEVEDKKEWLRSHFGQELIDDVSHEIATKMKLRFAGAA